MMNHILKFIDCISFAIGKISFFNVFSIFGNNFPIEMPLSIFMLIIGCIYTLVKFNFMPITKIGLAFRLMGGKDANTDGAKTISPIAALLVSAASTAGLGNTALIASGVLMFGPGIVFWIIPAIFISMGYRFAEIFLSHKYRQKEDGAYIGGPFLYMERGIKAKGYPKLGKILSVLYIGSSLCAGITIGMLEINQGTQILTSGIPYFKDYSIIISLIFLAIVGYIIFGGISRIANIFSKVLPVLVICFFIGSLIAIIANYKLIPSVFYDIITNAFHPKALKGGIFALIAISFRRVVLGTETGLGTAGMVYVNSKESDSIKNGMMGMVSPLINGIFIMTMTGFVVMFTGVHKDLANGDGIVLLASAFRTIHPILPVILYILMPIMALNVMIGWSVYGVQFTTYLLGTKFVKPFLVLYLVMGFLGGIIEDFQVVLRIAESVTMLIPIVNTIAIILLGNEIKFALTEFLNRRKNK